jgi:hypothetical protein
MGVKVVDDLLVVDRDGFTASVPLDGTPAEAMREAEHLLVVARNLEERVLAAKKIVTGADSDC